MTTEHTPEIAEIANILADHLRDYVGECICDTAYTERGLEDPACLWCNVGGSGFVMEGAKKIAAVVASPERQVRNVQARLREIGFGNTAARLESLVSSARHDDGGQQ